MPKMLSLPLRTRRTEYLKMGPFVLRMVKGSSSVYVAVYLRNVSAFFCVVNMEITEEGRIITLPCSAIPGVVEDQLLSTSMEDENASAPVA